MCIEIAHFGIDFLSLENTQYLAYIIMQFWNMPQLLLNTYNCQTKYYGRATRYMGNSSVYGHGTLHTKINILASISRKIFVNCYF